MVGNIGDVHKQSGEVELAKEHFELSYSTVKAVDGCQEDCASALHNLGVLNIDNGNYEEGIDCYLAAVKVRCEARLERTVEHASTLCNLASAYAKVEDREGSLRCFRDAAVVYNSALVS